jgi:hypothetical protein
VPPRYELASARDLVLAVPSGQIAAGPLEPNPAFEPPDPPPNGSPLMLWAVLALAVVVLGAVTLRAAQT